MTKTTVPFLVHITPSCAWSMLRTLLRLLPCRPSERARFRAQVIKLARSRVETGEQERKRELQLKEATFLLCAQQHLKELNARYFPTSGMSQQEVVAATAARVGFRMPKSDANPIEDAGTPSKH